MRNCKVMVLFLATLGVSSSAGIEQLLTKASAVVEGAVVDSTIVGMETTLKVRVSSVLFGSIPPVDTIAVACNGLKNGQAGPRLQPLPGIFVLRSLQPGGWECLPVSMMGNAMLGLLSYLQAPPCTAGNLQFLAPNSTRERILVRVAESALCGAHHYWQPVLEASSPGLRRLDADNNFDRRLFHELMKSTRPDVHFEGLLGLIICGDPLPLELIAKNVQEYRANDKEWLPLVYHIANSLQDPLVIPHLAKLLVIPDSKLRLATATALRHFHTSAAVGLLGQMLDTPVIEKELGVVVARGLADFANGCPMTTAGSFKTPADYFPHCDEKAPFRMEETISNGSHNPEMEGDAYRMISYWRGWWFSNRSRVAALALQP